MKSRIRDWAPLAACAATCLAPLSMAVTIAGCSDFELPFATDGEGEQAVATLRPTRDRRAWGVIRFQETRNGVRVFADVSGLPRRGRHAIHVHEAGDCSAPDASSAGKHFDFDTGLQPRQIAGNLGDLEVGSFGRAVFEAVIPRAKLEGERSIVGRAVIVHERANDPAAPDGNAGAAIACGVIASTDDLHS
jgi:Cu-Zn family superoxide dismutase